MTRTAVAVDEQEGYPEAGSALSFIASDTVNGNAFPWTGTEQLFARNTNASPQTLTFSYHRRGQLITQSAITLAAGEMRCFGPFVREMTEHVPSDEMTIHVTTSHANVLLAVRMLKQGNTFVSGLALWLDAQDYSGSGAWQDQSGYDNHCTFVGTAPSWDGTAFTFDGVDDYGVVNDADSLDLAGDFTIEMWYKPTSGSKGVFGKAEWTSPQNEDGFMVVGDTFHSEGSSSYSQVYSNGPMNVWQHAMIVRSGTAMSSYRNNSLEFTWTDGVVYSNDEEMRIGRIFHLGSPNFFTDKLAVIRIWTSALDSDERADAYAEFVARGL